MNYKIYTKKGDTGETSLIGGKRVPKYHIRVDAYGSVDELKSYMALIIDYQNKSPQNRKIKQIQEKLFRIESLLACEDNELIKNLPSITEKDVKYLEKEIDSMNSILPELKHFILPGGNILSAHAHVARCICRRAERIVIKLSTKEDIDGLILKYLNRLSDYLFVLSRYLCFNKNKCEEVIWKS